MCVCTYIFFELGQRWYLGTNGTWGLIRWIETESLCAPRDVFEGLSRGTVKNGRTYDKRYTDSLTRIRILCLE